MINLIQWAYIDPGTGSLIFQVLAATAMGVVVAFQSVRSWIVGFLCSNFRKKVNEGGGDVPDDSAPNKLKQGVEGRSEEE